ncbi:MAG: hypothetical protein R2700_12945 [Solirubrobacterales bacterium]
MLIVCPRAYRRFRPPCTLPIHTQADCRPTCGSSRSASPSSISRRASSRPRTRRCATELDLNARGAVGQARIEAEQIVAAAEERAAAIDAMTKVRVERRLEEQREALAKQAADLEVVTRARIAELKEAAAEMGGDTTDGGASEGVDRTDAEREEHP